MCMRSLQSHSQVFSRKNKNQREKWCVCRSRLTEWSSTSVKEWLALQFWFSSRSRKKTVDTKIQIPLKTHWLAKEYEHHDENNIGNTLNQKKEEKTGSRNNIPRPKQHEKFLWYNCRSTVGFSATGCCCCVSRVILYSALVSLMMM